MTGVYDLRDRYAYRVLETVLTLCVPVSLQEWISEDTLT